MHVPDPKWPLKQIYQYLVLSFIHHNANCFYDSAVGIGLKVLVSLLEHSVDNILVLCVHLLCLAYCQFNLKKKLTTILKCYDDSHKMI